MSKIKFYTAYDGSPLVPEVNTEPSQVMIAGFIPDDLRVKELLLAGERLEAFKLGIPMQEPDYDFGADDSVPDDYDSYDEYMDEMEAQDLYNQAMQRVQASIDAREALYSRRLREEAESKKKLEAVKDSEEPTKAE